MASVVVYPEAGTHPHPHTLSHNNPHSHALSRFLSYKQFEVYLKKEDEADKELELEYLRELGTRLAMSYGLVAKPKDTKQLLLLIQSGVTYVFEEAPERFNFFEGLHRFMSVIGSSAASVKWMYVFLSLSLFLSPPPTNNHIILTFVLLYSLDETLKQAKEKLFTFPPDTSDAENDAYHSWVAYLQKLAKGKGAAADELVEGGEEPPSKKRKTGPKVNKKLVPLEFEPVPSGKSSKRGEAEEEEEVPLVSKKGKKKGGAKKSAPVEEEEEAEEEEEEHAEEEEEEAEEIEDGDE